MTTTVILATLRRGARYGLDITQRTDLHPGTVYTALRRLESRDLVRGRWEDADLAEEERRPRRRYYELTGAGDRALDEALVHYGELARGLFGPPAPGASA